jgi:hypothetical protein
MDMQRGIMHRAYCFDSRMRLPSWFSIVMLLLACGGYVGEALAVPGVASVSGPVEDQGLVTIRGSGFGTKTVAEPYRWDDFDSGVPGERLLDEGAGGWYTSSAQAGRWPRYAVDRTRYPGTQSALQDFTNGNYNQTIGLVLPHDLGRAITEREDDPDPHGRTRVAAMGRPC